MATNPNNAIGTNGAYGGRTSVNAANDVLGLFKSRGILSGWEVLPNTGLTISLGGDGSTRDVAVAEDNAGNKTTINNISQDPVDVTIPAAPASNSRIDLVVAYVDNPPQGEPTVLDNPGACGLIVVSGTAAASPVAPNDSAIRSAITADGATGAQAYYVVLAKVNIGSGTTTLTSDNLSRGDLATMREPVATSTPVLGYGVGSRLMRIGNKVLLICPAQTNNVIPQTQNTGVTVAETIPVGYRPSEDIQIAVQGIGARIGNAGMWLKTDGSIVWYAAFQNSGIVRIAFNATWYTWDDFPEDDILPGTE